MWLSRLSVRFFLLYAILNLVMAVVYVTVVADWQRQAVMQQVRDRLQDTATVLQGHVNEVFAEGERERLQPLVEDLASKTSIRVSVIDPGGEVLADTHKNPGYMENHSNRPELQEAMTEGLGTSQRYSTTLKMPMFYLAVPVVQDEEMIALVRVALPLQSIQDRSASLNKFLWITALIVGVLAAALTFFAASSVLRPLSDLTNAAEAIAAGNYNQRIPAEGRGELGALSRAVSRMARELMRQLNELRDNSHRLESVLGSMVEGVIAVDGNLTVLLANEASRELLDIGVGEIVDRPLLEVTRQRVVREAALLAMQTGGSHETEFETLGTNRRSLRMLATPLTGEPKAGALIVLYDVSELRRLENIRREFVANVSHELKTPLASVKAYAETLRLGAIHDPDHNVQFVERIEEQAERLHQLILDLLHLARVESGREVFDVREVAIDEVLERCTPDYQERAAAKNLRLAVQIADVPLIALADEDGLVTVIDNLVYNAIQYTPEGGSVTIRCRAEEEIAILEVEDTGIGIVEHDQQRVFERFYRVDKARSRELGGTGLGLAIVKHLTQAFGGEVTLTSKLGFGSTFQVRLRHVQ